MGLFRLWIVGSVCWVGGAAWFLSEDLRLQDCADKYAGQALRALCNLQSRDQLFNEVQLEALEWITLPPLAALAVGLAFVWVISGFQDQKT